MTAKTLLGSECRLKLESILSKWFDLPKCGGMGFELLLKSHDLPILKYYDSYDGSIRIDLTRDFLVSTDNHNLEIINELIKHFDFTNRDLIRLNLKCICNEPLTIETDNYLVFK